METTKLVKREIQDAERIACMPPEELELA